MGAKDSQQGDGYSVTGHLDLMMPNRVSYEYDLRGPRYVGLASKNGKIQNILTFSRVAWQSKQVARLRLAHYTKP